jgi:hypothetical protein
MDPHDDELALASADGDGGLVRPVLWPASGRYAWTQPKSRKPAHPLGHAP